MNGTGVRRERSRSSAALGQRQRGHAGRRGQALLGARVGVVHAPVADLERHAAERGHAVGHQQHRRRDAARRPARPADAPRRSRSRRAPPPSGARADGRRASRAGARSAPPRPSRLPPARPARPAARRSRRCAPRRSPSGPRSPCRRARAGSPGRPPSPPCRWTAAAARGRRARGRRAAASPARRAGCRAARGPGGRAWACASPRSRRDPRWSGRGRRAAAPRAGARGDRCACALACRSVACEAS